MVFHVRTASGCRGQGQRMKRGHYRAKGQRKQGMETIWRHQ